MNEKAKKILIIIGAVLLFIIGFIFGRFLDRPGISGSDGQSNEIRTGIDILESNNKQLGNINTQLDADTKKLRHSTNSALDGVRTAKQILKAAKNRADNNSN